MTGSVAVAVVVAVGFGGSLAVVVIREDRGGVVLPFRFEIEELKTKRKKTKVRKRSRPFLFVFIESRPSDAAEGIKKLRITGETFLVSNVEHLFQGKSGNSDSNWNGNTRSVFFLNI